MKPAPEARGMTGGILEGDFWRKRFIAVRSDRCRPDVRGGGQRRIRAALRP